MENLTKVANDGLRTKLNGEKIKEVAEKYLREFKNTNSE